MNSSEDFYKTSLAAMGKWENDLLLSMYMPKQKPSEHIADKTKEEMLKEQKQKRDQTDFEKVTDDGVIDGLSD